MFFLTYSKEDEQHFSDLKGGKCQAKHWRKGTGDLIFSVVTSTTEEVYQASDFCETCGLGKISKKPVPKASENSATKKLESV